MIQRQLYQIVNVLQDFYSLKKEHNSKKISGYCIVLFCNVKLVNGYIELNFFFNCIFDCNKLYLDWNFKYNKSSYCQNNNF